MAYQFSKFELGKAEPTHLKAGNWAPDDIGRKQRRKSRKLSLFSQFIQYNIKTYSYITTKTDRIQGLKLIFINKVAEINHKIVLPWEKNLEKRKDRWYNTCRKRLEAPRGSRTDINLRDFAKDSAISMAICAAFKIPG